MNYILWLIAGYFIIATVLFLMQRSFIYFPQKTMPSLALHNAEHMSIIEVETADNLILKAWYHPPSQNKNDVIVVFHGNASHMGNSAYKMRSYVEQGYGVLLPAYRGYAGNPGSPSEKGLYKDAMAFIDWLLNDQNMSMSNVILYGESLGTGVAVQMASTEYKDIKALVLESPYTSFIDLAKRTYFWLPLNLLMRDKYETISKIDDIQAPLFIINGALDLIVPAEMGQQLFLSAPEPKFIKTIPRSGHNDIHLWKPEQHILDFLANL